MSSARDRRLADTFVTLADTLVDDFDVLDYLGLLAERASELLDVTAAGVLLADQRGGLRTAAGSSEHAELLELFAAQTQEGPCQDCIQTSAPVSSPDLSADTPRWPHFVPTATRAGFHAAYAVPMRLREHTLGALTLLNTHATPVGEDSAEIGQALADAATIGILQHRAINRHEVVTEQLQATLHRRVVVEQATGILAEHANLDTHHAYTLLRGAARTCGQRLSDLAHTLADGTTNPHDLLTPHTQTHDTSEVSE